MRLESLDFLRGVAVILVLFAHHWIGVDYVQAVGWVGVDLFFVLSGFLVSGLLFAEHKKFGDVHPVRFLVRRGFKIYPLFYLSFLATMILAVTVGFHDYDKLNNNGKIITTISEATFLQNYFGSFWNHHWSLAVEEHFYFLLAFVFAYLVRNARRFLLIFPISIALRLANQVFSPETGFAESHLRMDSLAMGVCIAYVSHFGDLKGFFEKYKTALYCCLPIPLVFMFTGNPLTNPFTKTIGFTLLYISFGALLIVFLYGNTKWIPGRKQIAWVGVYSYGIYLFHMYFVRFVVGDPGREFNATVVRNFLIYFAASISIGALLSWLIEKPFLKFRDRHFPRRTDSPLTNPNLETLEAGIGAVR
jgi:peptidoglycan/LPS O-acetylase OafA/YrhL